jgi:hypothetical protein
MTSQLSVFQVRGNFGGLLWLSIILLLGTVFSLGPPVNSLAKELAEVINVIDKSTLVRQEIRYKCPSATEVRLLWGINSWKTVPEEDRPAGTSFRRGVMQTPMKNMGEYFSMTVPVPAEAVLDFGFLITRLEKDADVRIWDANGTDSIHRAVKEGSLIEIVSTVETRQSSKAAYEGWRALPQLLIVLACIAIASLAGVRVITQRQQAWQRRALLPTFRSLQDLPGWWK